MADHSLCVKWSLLSSMFSTYSQRRQDQTQVIIIFEPQRGWGWAELGSASPFKRPLKHSNSNLPVQLSLQLEMWRLSTKIRHRHPNQHQTVLSVWFFGFRNISNSQFKNHFFQKRKLSLRKELKSTADFQSKWKTEDRTSFFFHVWESRNIFL